MSVDFDDIRAHQVALLIYITFLVSHRRSLKSVDIKVLTFILFLNKIIMFVFSIYLPHFSSVCVSLVHYIVRIEFSDPSDDHTLLVVSDTVRVTGILDFKCMPTPMTKRRILEPAEPCKRSLI